MNQAPLPENLKGLWAAEDEIRPWAEKIIAGKPYLADHLNLVVEYMDCVESMRLSGHSGDRFTALGGNFMRTFDSFSHSVRAAVSGNYSGAAMYARDLLETCFLIDYLLDQHGRPERWLKADLATANKEYAPVKIRIALDKRDGFEGKKRAQHYKALSALGSHPTPSALDMKRDGTRSINSRPFRQAELLEKCIQEAAKLAFILGGLLVRYCNSEIPKGVECASRLALALKRTRAVYFDHE